MAPQQLPLTVTDSAVRRIRVLRQKEKQPAASLRLRIIAGGGRGVRKPQVRPGVPPPAGILVSARKKKGFLDPQSPPHLHGADVEMVGGPVAGPFKITECTR